MLKALGILQYLGKKKPRTGGKKGEACEIQEGQSEAVKPSS